MDRSVKLRRDSYVSVSLYGDIVAFIYAPVICSCLRSSLIVNNTSDIIVSRALVCTVTEVRLFYCVMCC